MSDVLIISKDNCWFCNAAKDFMDKSQIAFTERKLGRDIERDEVLELAPTAKTFPVIFINNKYIGGHQQLLEYVENTGFNGQGFTL